MFKKYKTDPQGVAAHFFSIFRKRRFTKIDISGIHICWKGNGDLFCICWSHLVSPKFKRIDLGSHGHVYQVRKSRKWWLVGFSQSEIEKWLVEHGETNSTELLGLSFYKTYSKNGTPDPPTDPKSGMFPHFPGFVIGDRFFLRLFVLSALQEHVSRSFDGCWLLVHRFDQTFE